MNERTEADDTTAFSLAKEALAMVGRFQTPPNPKVYEVWYRYVEGKNEAIREQLAHAVEESGEVETEFLEQLHDQFCVVNSDVTDRLGAELSNQMAAFRSLINKQIDAGEEFSSSIHTANDTLEARPESPEDIETCITQLLQSNQSMESQLQSTQKRLNESQSQVEGLRKDLDDSQEKIMTDPLTGVGNRRFFDTMMTRSVGGTPESSSTFLVLVDLDEFKEINDNFGHSVGDDVLKFVSSEIQRIRADASIARYGGDEFAVFLTVEEAQQATDFANEIRRVCATNRLKHSSTGASLGRIGVSIGVARLRQDDDRESWFDRADKLLYRAKESGRNCVMAERALSS